MIDSRIDNELSGRVSINESARNNKGFFTDEEQEDINTDRTMLPVNKKQKKKLE